MGGIYDFKKIDSIRYFSSAYFHGHSVGGTNPSLLEAMASSCFIIANDNIFNRTVLKNNALYFDNKNDVSSILNDMPNYLIDTRTVFIENNLSCIRNEYSWEKLIDDHEKYFQWMLKQKR